MARKGVTISVRTRDLGWDAIKTELKKAKHRGSFVKVGSVGNRAIKVHDSESGLTNAELMAIHELGLPPHIPARSFIGSTVEENRVRYTIQLATLLRQVYSGRMKIAKALSILGLMVTSDIKKRVMTGAGIPPANAESTIAAKENKGKWKRKGSAAGASGSPRPLIDTGRMIGAVGYEVLVANKKTEEG